MSKRYVVTIRLVAKPFKTVIDTDDDYNFERLKSEALDRLREAIDRREKRDIIYQEYLDVSSFRA